MLTKQLITVGSGLFSHNRVGAEESCKIYSGIKTTKVLFKSIVDYIDRQQVVKIVKNTRFFEKQRSPQSELKVKFLWCLLWETEKIDIASSNISSTAKTINY